MRKPQRQRGVALLLALVLVALVTIIAYDIWFSGSLEQRRAFASLSLERGFQYGIGTEAAAAKLLLLDSQNGAAQDFPAEQWAQPFPPTAFGSALVEGRIDDMEGRFNLNSLIDPTTGAVNPDRVDQFRRLLEIAGLEAKWADLLTDWIDTDLQPTFPDGGEDNLYTMQTPPYLPPNTAITSTSELMALPGFGIERYRRLEPYIAALPPDAKLNVCFASGPVLDSLSTAQTQYQDAAFLAKQREGKCFPTIADVQRTLGPDFTRVQGYVSEKTQYFRVTSVTTIGTAQFTLYSLLKRSNGGLSQPILRSWGNE
jgi:general secretion pathway protein K